MFLGVIAARRQRILNGTVWEWKREEDVQVRPMALKDSLVPPGPKKSIKRERESNRQQERARESKREKERERERKREQ